MEIEKALINDRLRVSKVSWKFGIPTICNFAVIYPWNLLFSLKVAYFLTFLLSFLFINKTLRLNNLKTRTAMNVVFVICVETIIYLLLCNLHDCTFNVPKWPDKFQKFYSQCCKILKVCLIILGPYTVKG